MHEAQTVIRYAESYAILRRQMTVFVMFFLNFHAFNVSYFFSNVSSLHL